MPRNKIRVLHLVDNLDLGGAQTAIFSLLEHFNRDRFEVVLTSIHANRKSIFIGRAAEFGVVVLSPRKWLPWYLISLPWILLTGGFQVVHCHLYYSNWLGKPLAKLFRVPVIISHDHCYERFRFDWRWVAAIDKWANQFANRILVIAESIRGELIKVEKVPAKKIEIMRNGLAAHAVSDRKKIVRKTIGSAGRFVDWKRFDRFLVIAKYLIELDPEYRFQIAGGGPDEALLREQATKLGVASHLTWKGQLPSLGEFFAEIDLLILTSDLEDIPMILMESMYHGVPTAAVVVNEARRDLAGDLLALEISRNEQDWAQSIHALFQSSDDLWNLGERGQARIRKEYMARERIRRIEEIYHEELVSRKPIN